MIQMKINTKKIVSSVICAVTFLPMIAFAAGLVPSDSAIAADGFGSLAALFNNIINWFVGISIAVAAITFSIAGAEILFHPESSGKIEDAKKMLWKTVQGMFIILIAWLVIHTVIATLVNPSTGALRFLKS